MLANTYCKLKNSEKSIEYCDKAIKHSTNKYGEKSIETIRLKVVKAKILEEQKDLQGAIAVLEEAISN